MDPGSRHEPPGRQFQSLFSWNLLLMSRGPVRVGSDIPVSILVFVELALDACHWRWVPWAGSWFQSLFSWNLLLMPEELAAYREWLCSFNPCFRGTCSWWPSRVRPVSVKFSVSILVFVELALDVLAIQWVNIPWQCFNPCFRGTCSWCLEARYELGQIYQFQSLFSWNLLLMLATGGGCRGRVPGFNPCFRGTCSWCPKSLPRIENGYAVSILVFVELALDGHPGSGRWVWNSQFQSLFSWNLLLMF